MMAKSLFSSKNESICQQLTEMCTQDIASFHVENRLSVFCSRTSSQELLIQTWLIISLSSISTRNTYPVKQKQKHFQYRDERIWTMDI